MEARDRLTAENEALGSEQERLISSLGAVKERVSELQAVVAASEERERQAEKRLEIARNDANLKCAILK